MPLEEMLILTTPPDCLHPARQTGLTLGHMAYRVGPGCRLLRAPSPAPLRGGLMVLDARGFDGRGDAPSFCQEVLRECAARGFSGVICDFEGRPLPLLERVVTLLEQTLERRGLTLHVPEHCTHCVRRARVLIPSALSGGSLRRRLEEAAQRLGSPERITLAVERSAEDFFLPAPSGSGRRLSREELAQRLARRGPSVFFSDDLCARYFTYMSRDSGAHFVLFDDASSIRKKLQVARSLGIPKATLAWPEVEDIFEELGVNSSK